MSEFGWLRVRVPVLQELVSTLASFSGFQPGFSFSLLFFPFRILLRCYFWILSFCAFQFCLVVGGLFCSFLPLFSVLRDVFLGLLSWNSFLVPVIPPLGGIISSEQDLVSDQFLFLVLVL